MIELKNVSKTYKSKKGKSTKALDNVTLTLEEKGMTFILGKSGSGKSTLLNVLGGLDKYDEGEISILGKSSKDFSQKDFDSYRNTYVGFIFQEFNILEDYDVYENIVLALQLQQKEVNESEVDKLLDRLDIKDLKKRKVNELSGGQKQRVAIARALIKNPKIIFADEPTGNLDSSTGKGVMELLKEISKEKLVVVVSHDVESAKKYGDRIIEIKDGNVISDSKTVKESKKDNTYKTISSKLPFKESFKLGLGSLKHKKVKLVFTIILIIFTLGFLSASDTLSSYDFGVTQSNVMNSRNDNLIEVENKLPLEDEYGIYGYKTMELKSNDEKSIMDKVGKKGYSVYSFNSIMCYDECNISDVLHVKRNDSENYFGSSGLEVVVVDKISDLFKEKITGRSAENANEIVISSYLADNIIKNGIEVYETVVNTEFKKSNLFEPKSYEEIVNSKYNYYFGEVGKVKIVGIVNFESNKDEYYVQNYTRKIYVSDSFIDNVKKENLVTFKFYTDINIDGIKKDEYSISSGNTAILKHSIEYFDGNSWKKTSSLKENEAIVSIDSIVDDYESYSNDLNNYVNNNSYGFYSDYDELNKKFKANYIKEKGVIGKNLKLVFSLDYNEVIYKKFDNIKVVGVFIDDECSENVCYTYSSYFSESQFKDYVKKPFEKTSVLFKVSDKKDIKNISNMYPYENEFGVKSSYSQILYGEASAFNMLAKISFYVSLVFLVFTVFLIVNFMFTSITYRKKEIGVLRALGSRSMDVIKIFLWEAICLSVISGTIASILLVVVSNFMNKFIMGIMDTLTTPFVVGIRQFLVIYIVVFLLTIISSILPLLKISKMKPIDAILNK